MYDFDNSYDDNSDSDCGHHCDDSCPRCGDYEQPLARKAKAATPRPQGVTRVVRRARCSCEGSYHNHGCPNGM